MGLHALAAMSFDLSPGPWRVGVAPALKLSLRTVSADAGDALVERPTRPPARTPGIAGAKAQDGSSVPVVPRYYSNREVDIQAVPVSTGPLVYPESAYLAKLRGMVRVRVFISEEGAVESVQVIDAKPRRGIFEEAALEALRQVRYKPAEIGGTPVKSQKLIEVKFNPYEDDRSAVD